MFSKQACTTTVIFVLQVIFVTIILLVLECKNITESTLDGLCHFVTALQVMYKYSVQRVKSFISR